MPRWTSSLEERIRAKTREGPNGCLVWTGAMANGDYPVIRVNGRNAGVARVVWALATNAPAPEDRYVRLRCTEPKCVAFEHLFLSTSNAKTVLSLEERFWAKVEKSDGCWLWVGGKTSAGYGAMAAGPEGVKLAHVVSWELHNGPVPDGTEVCHDCDTPPCVRPDHLFLGTHIDNMRDMVSKDRSSGKLTIAQVNAIRERYIPRDSSHGCTAMAREFGVTVAAISAVTTGRTFKHIPTEAQSPAERPPPGPE